ncbi:ATP-binding cassette domain-containing protein [Bacteroidia bacterium]|nr:ATP-binding cassette domain-containing protein [Bacteroidia bacterium]
MAIILHHLKPSYMSATEVAGSDIYLQNDVIFEQGKKYLIRANSGHGKSSLLNFIYGSNPNYDGKIKYNDALNQQVFDLRQSKISYVFQDFKLFPELTIFENIQLKNTLTHHKTTTEINQMIDDVLLGHKKDTLVTKLSLGQRQRVAIIRALCQPFEFLLLDEPFSHLDNQNIQILTQLISQEIKSQNASLLMTSLGEDHFFSFDKILNL